MSGHVCVHVRELAVLRDGRLGTARDGQPEPVLPVLFRDSSEIRRATDGAEL